MNRFTYGLCFAALAASALIGACGGGDEKAQDMQCAAGTVAKDGACVPEITGCGAGTVAQGNACVPTCATGKYWDGASCADVPSCAAGTTFDAASGACVPACPNGKAWNGEACVDLTACGAGTVFDADAGSCVPDNGLCGAGTEMRDGACVSVLQCGAGTHADGGVCVVDEPPKPDVSESGDPATAAKFDLPASGGSITLGGTVDIPQDLNDDGYVDGNWDAFVVTAPAGTWLRLTATSDGATLPVFIVQSVDVDASQKPLYTRYALNPLGKDSGREVYLPRAGDYVVLVSDYTNMMISVFGSGLFPVGGPDFTYRVKVENLGAPQPRAVDALPLSDSGTLGNGALVFYTLKGLAVRDVLTINSPAKPVPDKTDDVIPGWQLFDPSGALAREVIGEGWETDAASTMVLAAAGDYLLVQDFALSIGPALDYGMKAVREAVKDCTAAACTVAPLAAGESQLWSFDIKAGDLFVFGATVAAGATENLRVNFLDSTYTLISEASTGPTWPRSDHLLATADTWVYLYVAGWSGLAVPDYTLEYALFPVPTLPQNGVIDGVAAHKLPDAALNDSAFVRFDAKAGELMVVSRFVAHDPGNVWTKPAQGFVDPAFLYLGPAVDTLDAALAPLSPAMAWIQADGAYLYRASDEGASTDLSGASCDLTLARVTPTDLGSPIAGTPVSAAALALDPAVAAKHLQFTAAASTSYDVTVTPKGAGLQPDVRVYDLGYHYQTTWYASPAQKELGQIAKGQAAAPGAAAVVTIAAPYAGKLLIGVYDALSGSPVPTEQFDVQVSVKP